VKLLTLPNHRKWYLSLEEEVRFKALNPPAPLGTFVAWTVATGLRVEETLALRWRDVDLEARTCAVPGTKTAMAQALLPISEEARDALRAHKPPTAQRGDPVFTVGYFTIAKQWQRVRVELGLQDVHTATLKSLRRSFARRAHLNGMPADVLRQYLRHGSLKTTMGYLHLVGGYSQDEMRKYLS
jgi:integrase